MRVPTPDVSIVDLTAELEKDATTEEVNDAFRRASEGRMKGILGYEEAELVSVDYIGNPHSSIVDAPSTNVMSGHGQGHVLVRQRVGLLDALRGPRALRGRAALSGGGGMRKLTLDDMSGRRAARQARAGPRGLQRPAGRPASEVTDDTRIRATLPDARAARGAPAPAWSSSRTSGRPRGSACRRCRSAPPRVGWRSSPTGRWTSSAIPPGSRRVEATRELGDGEILVLENTRFEPGEEKNDAGLARRMAELGDLYVNDAFGAAHRAHASTAGVAEVVRERGAGSRPRGSS